MDKEIKSTFKEVTKMENNTSRHKIIFESAGGNTLAIINLVSQNSCGPEETLKSTWDTLTPQQKENTASATYIGPYLNAYYVKRSPQANRYGFEAVCIR